LRGIGHHDGQTSANTNAGVIGNTKPGLERPHPRLFAASVDRRANARTTGMPVRDWPPTEPAPINFQHGCAPVMNSSINRRSRKPPSPWPR